MKPRFGIAVTLMCALLAAPAAVDYYPKLGFTKHGSAWVLRAGEKLLGG